jgi:hypothetical protein
MMKFFRDGSLVVRLRMSSMTTRMGVLTGLMAAGLASPAQVRAQATQNRLIITNVEVDYTQRQMFIYGRNFNTPTGAPPIVHLMEIGVDVKIYGPSTVVVALPELLLRPGSYLLTMSAGPNVEQNDSFDVTLGTVGSQGPEGLATLAKTTPEAAGTNCVAGGTKLELGTDANRNGVLDITEVDWTLTKYLCNGERGLQGQKGDRGSFAGCTLRSGPKSTSRSYASASWAVCETDEILTGGACALADGTTSSTSGTFTSNGGRSVYACKITGPMDTTGVAIAQAMCCRTY